MHRIKRAVPLALTVGLIAAVPGAAEAASGARGPVAHASGGDVVAPIYPGLVNTRLVRTEKALDRAANYADDGQSTQAISALYAARLQVKLAWRAAKYQIENAPPPPPADDLQAVRVPIRVHSRARHARKHKVRAHKSGGAVATSTIADQYTTAAAVLSAQHDVAQVSMGLVDTSHGKLRDSLSRTIFTALDQRDAAVAYIHSIDVPPPPADDIAKASRAPVAHASGGAVGVDTWATVMPPVSDMIDDEVNQAEGIIDLSTTLGVGIRRILQDAEFQAVKTQRNVNLYWPPVPADD
jgi:hypothetical protein